MESKNKDSIKVIIKKYINILSVNEKELLFFYR